MTRAEVLEELCGILQAQTCIIQAQAEALEMLGAEVMAAEIAETEKRITRLEGEA